MNEMLRNASVSEVKMKQIISAITLAPRAFVLKPTA